MPKSLRDGERLHRPQYTGYVPTRWKRHWTLIPFFLASLSAALMQPALVLQSSDVAGRGGRSYSGSILHEVRPNEGTRAQARDLARNVTDVA